MSKTAYIFPGQGSQYVGMGKELHDHFAEARQVFEEADEALGFSISDLCFNGPEEELKKTYNTQPAILTASVAAYRVLEKEGFRPDFVAGHSLGEYSALVAAGALTLRDAVQLVRKRGTYMQEAVPLGEGTMAAILGLDNEKVEEICKAASKTGVVEPANYNCPGQLVIAGAVAAVEEACRLAKAAGAKRAVLLPVSAPFHCSLMAPAAQRLGRDLEEIDIDAPKIPVMANVDASYAKTPFEVHRKLLRQVDHAVLWEASVEFLVEDGATTFIEVGPGKVLSGLVKKISKDVETLHVEDLASLEKVLAYLRGRV